MVAPSKLSIDSPGGIEYVRKILLTAISHPLHDYILEGLCKAAAGKHVLSVLLPGGGKTSYMYGFMKLLQMISKLPEPCPSDMKPIPKNPLMVAVFPTKGLEEDLGRHGIPSKYPGMNAGGSEGRDMIEGKVRGMLHERRCEEFGEHIRTGELGFRSSWCYQDDPTRILRSRTRPSCATT